MIRRKPPKLRQTDDAPGNLALVQAFLNTRAADNERDDFADLDGMNQWLIKMSVVDPANDEARREAIQVRQGLLALLQGRLKDQPLRDLNAALGEMRYHLHVTPQGELQRLPAEGGWRGLLSRLLDVMEKAMAEGQWQRLKICASQTCARAFYDRSSNKSGKWCIARGCGSRSRTRAYRERQTKGSSPK